MARTSFHWESDRCSFVNKMGDKWSVMHGWTTDRRVSSGMRLIPPPFPSSSTPRGMNRSLQWIEANEDVQQINFISFPWRSFDAGMWPASIKALAPTEIKPLEKCVRHWLYLINRISRASIQERTNERSHSRTDNRSPQRKYDWVHTWYSTWDRWCVDPVSYLPKATAKVFFSFLLPTTKSYFPFSPVLWSTFWIKHERKKGRQRSITKNISCKRKQRQMKAQNFTWGHHPDLEDHHFFPSSKRLVVHLFTFFRSTRHDEKKIESTRSTASSQRYSLLSSTISTREG